MMIKAILFLSMINFSWANSRALEDVVNLVDDEVGESHNTILIRSSQSSFDFSKSLEILRGIYPQKSLSYNQFEFNNCQMSENDLSDLQILIIASELEDDNFSFKISYRSGIKNLYGNVSMNFQLDSNNNVKFDERQYFFTSIGE